MPIFVLAYRNRPGYTPTPQTQAAWHAWFGSMGDQLADMGKPVIAEAALGNCSRESTEMGGYSLIEADDLEAATAIAKAARTWTTPAASRSACGVRSLAWPPGHSARDALPGGWPGRASRHQLAAPG